MMKYEILNVELEKIFSNAKLHVRVEVSKGEYEEYSIIVNLKSENILEEIETQLKRKVREKTNLEFLERMVKGDDKK